MTIFIHIIFMNSMQTIVICIVIHLHIAFNGQIITVYIIVM